jgi:sucrose-6-phosphate hydrolase SacC (GH32 family)
VDRSSVEVFGNDGENTITDLIFPDPESRGVQAYASGGKATLSKLDVWRLVTEI